MGFDKSDLSKDKFLGGKLDVLQPKRGYRAATDPVFLAAAVSAKQGQSVFEPGCGVGVASLCLGQRLPGLVQFGLEIQPDYAELAVINAEGNHIPLQIVVGDIAGPMPDELRRSFDQVILNPPFYPKGQATAPAPAGKSMAHIEEVPLAGWIDAGLKRLSVGGCFTLIHLASKLPEILNLFRERAGDIRIKPLAPRAGRKASRVIVSARKGRKGEARLLAPLILHKGDHHQKDGNDFSDEAEAVLRHGQALDLGN